MKQGSGRGTGTKMAEVPADLTKLERLLQQAPVPTPDRVCAEIARILRVQHTEVALLRMEKEVLKFLFPSELRAAGSIPLSSSAVAARTAVTKTSVLSNTFVKVKHVSLFETVRLGLGENNNSQEPAPIQKLMSVPVQDADNKVLGVIQTSRKGVDPNAVGPDFSMDDLRQLEAIARIVAKLEFMENTFTTPAK
jgi:hypothetical protein